jgi:hypothetical protein
MKELEGLGTALAHVALAGLVGGGVPTLLFVPLRRLGLMSAVCSNGLVGMFSYLLACSWAFGELPKDGRGWWIMIGVGGFFGLLVGHVLVHPLAVAARQRAR